METKHASFTKFFEDYVQTWSLFVHLFLLGPVLLQYRELAKLYHPDAGGDHTDFLALQQAYEQEVEYLHTRR